MEKIKLSRNEYDAVVEKYREQHCYEDMSEDDKLAFDEKLNKVIECSSDDEAEEMETSDCGKLRAELKEQYGYSKMSDEQKQAFNEKLDEIVGTEDNGEEDPADNEIGTRVLRRR